MVRRFISCWIYILSIFLHDYIRNILTLMVNCKIIQKYVLFFKVKDLKEAVLKLAAADRLRSQGFLRSEQNLPKTNKRGEWRFHLIHCVCWLFTFDLFLFVFVKWWAHHIIQIYLCKKSTYGVWCFCLFINQFKWSIGDKANDNISPLKRLSL